MRQQRGVTLVELLIAMSILMVILGMTAGFFLSSRRAYEANRTTTTAMNYIRSVIDTVRYDLSLAGYLGLDASGLPPVIDTPLAFDLDDCETNEGCAVQSVVANYFEDRFSPDGSPVPMAVSYSLDSDGNLTRRVGGGDATPIASGIESLRLLRFERRGGSSRPAASEMPADLAGLVFRVTYSNGQDTYSEDFSVPLLNQQIGL